MKSFFDYNDAATIEEFANGVFKTSQGSRIENFANNSYVSCGIDNGKFGWCAETGYLIYDSRGGTISSTSSSIFNIGANGHIISETDFPASATKDGCTFGGWYLDQACTIEAKGHTIYNTTTIYASWPGIKYWTVVFDYGYGGVTKSEEVEEEKIDEPEEEEVIDIKEI